MPLQLSPSEADAPNSQEQSDPLTRRWSVHFYFGFAPLLASIVLAYCLVTQLWDALRRGQIYTDLVVGCLAWADFDKARDFRALYLFLGVGAVCWLGISAFFRWIAPEGPESEKGTALNRLLIYSLLPALAWICLAASLSGDGRLPIVAAFPAILALGSVAGLIRYRGTLSGQAILDIGGAVLMSALFAAFAGTGLASLLARLFSGKVARWEHAESYYVAASAGAAILVVLFVLATTATIEELRNRLFQLVLLTQIPLPLLWSVLIPPPILDATGIHRAHYSARLPILVAVVAAVSWLFWARCYLRWHAQRSGETSRLPAVLCSTTLIAIAVYVAVPLLPPPSIKSDFFHPGEQLLPWQQFWHWGKVPYVDFVPIHGLMPLLRGLFDELFFDGTAQGFVAVEALMIALWSTLTFLTLRPLVGPFVALLLASCSAPWDRFYFLAPALFFLADPARLARPARWLMAWLVVGPLMILYNPAIGPAFLLGTAPAALWMSWNLLLSNRLAFLTLALVAGAALAAVLGWHTSRDIIVGMARFVQENAATNQVANGTSWEQGLIAAPRESGFAATRFTWEVLRFAWLLVVAAGAYVACRELAKPVAGRNRSVLWLAALAVPTLLIIAQWAHGRIDPGVPSRTGAESFVAVLFLLPAFFLAGRPALPGGLATALVAIVCLMDPHHNLLALLDEPVNKSFAVRRLSNATALMDGSAAGIPKVGQAQPGPEIESVIELKHALASWLQPGETFFDFTNKSAYYYYLDLPVPTLYASSYVAGNTACQARMLRQIEANTPPVALIAPALELDCVPASLRSYHLYREFVMRFLPVRRGSFTFLVDPERLPAKQPQLRERLTLLNEVFRPKHLHNLPAAWGRSFAMLSKRFDSVAKLTLTSASAPAPVLGTLAPENYGAETNCVLPEGGIQGCDADLLMVRIRWERRPNRPDPILRVRWDIPGIDVSDEALAIASGPCLLIPLGSYPSWLLANRIASLHVGLANPETCSSFAVESVELMHIRPARQELMIAANSEAEESIGFRLAMPTRPRVSLSIHRRQPFRSCHPGSILRPTW